MAFDKKEYQKEYDKKTNYQAQKKYNQKALIRVAVSINRNTDADIIEWLDSQDNKQGYIKELIRADMKRKNVKWEKPLT